MSRDASWRVALAAVIAPRTVYTTGRIAEALAVYDRLLLSDEEKVQAIDAGIRLVVSGMTPEMLDVFVKVAARGVIDGSDLVALQQQGIKARVWPMTVVYDRPPRDPWPRSPSNLAR